MKTILMIIGIIAVIWIGLLLFFHIVLYIAFCFSEETKYTSVQRDISLYGTQFDEWYIIPTISFHLEFKDKSYPSFNIIWLKWNFNVSYHLKTEEEEDIEAEVRQKLNKQK